jgi:hypothetical protein
MFLASRCQPVSDGSASPCQAAFEGGRGIPGRGLPIALRLVGRRPVAQGLCASANRSPSREATGRSRNLASSADFNRNFCFDSCAPAKDRGTSMGCDMQHREALPKELLRRCQRGAVAVEAWRLRDQSKQAA